MDTTITLNDLLRIILYLSGTGALIFLALALKNLVKITGLIKETLVENQPVIDGVIKKLPELTDNANEISLNANRISADTADMLKDIKPEVERLMVTVGGVSDTVQGLTHTIDTTTLKLTDTVSDITDSISDTAKTISFNANNIIDYFYILREVLEALRDVFLKK